MNEKIGLTFLIASILITSLSIYSQNIFDKPHTLDQETKTKVYNLLNKLVSKNIWEREKAHNELSQMKSDIYYYLMEKSKEIKIYELQERIKDILDSFKSDIIRNYAENELFGGRLKGINYLFQDFIKLVSSYDKNTTLNLEQTKLETKLENNIIPRNKWEEIVNLLLANYSLQDDSDVSRALSTLTNIIKKNKLNNIAKTFINKIFDNRLSKLTPIYSYALYPFVSFLIDINYKANDTELDILFNNSQNCSFYLSYQQVQMPRFQAAWGGDSRITDTAQHLCLEIFLSYLAHFNFNIQKYKKFFIDYLTNKLDIENLYNFHTFIAKLGVLFGEEAIKAELLQLFKNNLSLELAKELMNYKLNPEEKKEIEQFILDELENKDIVAVIQADPNINTPTSRNAALFELLGKLGTDKSKNKLLEIIKKMLEATKPTSYYSSALLSALNKAIEEYLKSIDIKKEGKELIEILSTSEFMQSSLCAFILALIKTNDLNLITNALNELLTKTKNTTGGTGKNLNPPSCPSTGIFAPLKDILAKANATEKNAFVNTLIEISLTYKLNYDYWKDIIQGVNIECSKQVIDLLSNVLKNKDINNLPLLKSAVEIIGDLKIKELESEVVTLLNVILEHPTFPSVGIRLASSALTTPSELITRILKTYKALEGKSINENTLQKTVAYTLSRVKGPPYYLEIDSLSSIILILSEMGVKQSELKEIAERLSTSSYCYSQTCKENLQKALFNLMEKDKSSATTNAQQPKDFDILGVLKPLLESLTNYCEIGQRHGLEKLLYNADESTARTIINKIFTMSDKEIFRNIVSLVQPTNLDDLDKFYEKNEANLINIAKVAFAIYFYINFNNTEYLEKVQNYLDIDPLNVNIKDIVEELNKTPETIKKEISPPQTTSSSTSIPSTTVTSRSFVPGTYQTYQIGGSGGGPSAIYFIKKYIAAQHALHSLLLFYSATLPNNSKSKKLSEIARYYLSQGTILETASAIETLNLLSNQTLTSKLMNTKISSIDNPRSLNCRDYKKEQGYAGYFYQGYRQEKIYSKEERLALKKEIENAFSKALSLDFKIEGSNWMRSIENLSESLCNLQYNYTNTQIPILQYLFDFINSYNFDYLLIIEDNTLRLTSFNEALEYTKKLTENK